MKRRTTNDLRMTDIVHDPLAHFLRAVFRATLDLNLWRTYIGIERGVDSLTDKGSFFLESEMFEATKQV